MDEEARRLDELEIAAFRSTVRARKWFGRTVILVVLAGVSVIALAASTTVRERGLVVFERKPGCLFDGCFCRGKAELEQTACPPPDSRACLPIADTCR